MIRPPTIEDAVRTKAEGRSSVLRWLPSLTSLAFILPLVLLFWQAGGPSSLLSDPITGVAIRAGQWILSHRTIPRHGLFSFTQAHHPWCDWEWLSDVVYALVYRIHGLRAIAAFHLVVLCLTSVIVYRSARLRSGQTVGFAVTGLVMATTTIHWLARPHLFSWLCVALLTFLLERADVTGRNGPLLALPVLMIFWVNLHPGFVAGLLVLGVWSAWAVLRWRFMGDADQRLRRRRQALSMCLTLAACLAMTFVNPYSWRLDWHIVSYLGSSHTVTSHVAEWLSPEFRNPRLHWFEVLLPIAAAAGIWQGVRGHLAHCALVFIWLHLALMSVRNVPLFAIVSAGPVAAAGARFLERYSFSEDLRTSEVLLGSIRHHRGAAAAYALACTVLVGIFWWGPVNFGPAHSLPTEAAWHLPAGRVFTTDRWADYLIYIEPDRQVFFDGRNDAYGEDPLNNYLTVMRAQPGWKKIFSRYGITAALVPRDAPISAILAIAPQWTLAYHDRVAAVYLETGSKGAATFRRKSRFACHFCP